MSDNFTQEQLAAIERIKAMTDVERTRLHARNALLEIEREADFYATYIQSEEWRARAEDAKARAGYRCRVCNSSRDLNAHHRTYERLGNEDPEDITVLCHSCHELFHQYKRLAR